LLTLEAIRTEVKARPDATLAELRRRLAQTHEVTASNGLMHDTTRKLGLTLKKRHCTPPSKNVLMSLRRW
jgi:transposase